MADKDAHFAETVMQASGCKGTPGHEVQKQITSRGVYSEATNFVPMTFLHTHAHERFSM